MSKRSYLLGGRDFGSKEAARKFVSKLLHELPLGPVNEDLSPLLFDLLSRHPDAEEKIGAGVARFEVAVDTAWGSRQFHAIRANGERTRFSYNACFEPAMKAADATAKRALRNEIAPQIDAFRARWVRGGGTVVDAVTGEAIPTGDVHVDHAPPTFNEITILWLRERGLRLEQLAVTPHGDTDSPTLLTNRAVAHDWQRFHLDRARLRCVAKATNLSLLRKRVA